MARRKSTRKGQYRKGSRRAYEGLKKTRRRRRYGSRRGRVSFARRRTKSTGLVKRRAMGALKECAWVTGGSAVGLAVNRYIPANRFAPNDLVIGGGSLAWGIYKNDPKAIYLGFGALYPRIYNQLQSVIG